MSAAKPTAQAGFTLIEVLIVSLLLIFLAFTLFQVIRSTVTAKEDIDQHTETFQSARAAQSLLERDLRASYMITPEDLGWTPLMYPGDGGPARPRVRPLVVAIFQGEKDSVFMTTQTHQRLSTDAPENEQHFVTYQLQGGDLIRAESPHAVNLYDREDPSRFKQFTILTQVKKFNLAYWDKKSEKWVDRWDSDGTDYKEQLPAGIKVDLEFLPDVAKSRRAVEIIKVAFAVIPAQAALKSSPAPAAAAQPSTQPGQGATQPGVGR